MLIAVNAREAVRSLLASKQRTILALLGVIIGIGSVMAMLSVGETVKGQALEQFKAMGTDILTISPGGFGGSQEGSLPPRDLTPEDFEMVARYAKSIRSMAQEVTGWGKVRAGKAEVSGSLKGVSPAYRDINRLSLQSGRFFSFLDEERPFAILGSVVAGELAQKGAKTPIAEVTINGKPFEVVGLLNPAQLGYRSDEVDRSVFLPLRLAQLHLNQPGVSQVTMRIKPEVDHRVAQAEIERLMNTFQGRATPLSFQSPRQLIEQMSKQMRLYTLLLAAVGSISLVVGGVGIMNMMLVSVTERRREIGIRRALGAQQADITSQFLVESVILSLSGGVLGLALGVAAALVTAASQGWKPVVPITALFLCMGVALAVGLFFGYYPARKASHLDVIVALKAE